MNAIHLGRTSLILLSVLLVASSLSTAEARYGRHGYLSRRAQRRDYRYASSRGTFNRKPVEHVSLNSLRTPMTELRAMWVVRDSISSPQQIDTVIRTAQHFGFNTLFVQVRGRGDAFYNSTLEPRAEELSDQPLSFDPLATVIAKAHAAHIQVHAWLNTFYVWGAGRKPYAPDHVVNTHPDWLARDQYGVAPLGPTDGCEGAFLSPANADAAKHIHDVFLEVATKYDVDGIHFDYVRYANENFDYSPAALDGFRSYLDTKLAGNEQQLLGEHTPMAYVQAFPDEWADWRRQQVTNLVSSISADIKAVKPWVVVSAAVFADSKDAYISRGQDWKDWLNKGYLDAVVPMAYGTSTELVARQLQDACDAARAAGRVCYAGIGSYHITAESTAAKIAAARTAGAEGIVLFSYGGVTNNGTSLNYLDKLANGSIWRPAILPKMAWLPPRSQQENAN